MSHGFGETAIKRAVDNLAAACFLHREGATLIPAPAVVNFDQGTTPTKF
jgi:stage V sporulation protein SpoVS